MMFTVAFLFEETTKSCVRQTHALPGGSEQLSAQGAEHAAASMLRAPSGTQADLQDANTLLTAGYSAV